MEILRILARASILLASLIFGVIWQFSDGPWSPLAFAILCPLVMDIIFSPAKVDTAISQEALGKNRTFPGIIRLARMADWSTMMVLLPSIFSLALALIRFSK